MVKSKSESDSSLLTAKQAAKYLNVSLNTLWRMERRRLIIPYRLPGGHRRYSLEMLNTYLENTRGQSDSG